MSDTAERLITAAVDARFEQLRRRQPYTAYGNVAAVSTSTLTCSVYISGEPTASLGFRYGKIIPVVGARVRVVIDPRGDRYIDDVYGEGYPRIERPVGGSFMIGQVDADADDRARFRIATDGSGNPAIYLGDGAEAIGAELVQLARIGNELRLITGTGGRLRFNDSSGGIRIVEVTTTGSGSTHFIANADIPQAGGCLLVSNGNDGVGIMGWYRAGSFNFVTGLWAANANTLGFQGNVTTPGAQSWSWYVESQAVGARLAVKANAGFARSFRLLTLG